MIRFELKLSEEDNTKLMRLVAMEILKTGKRTDRTKYLRKLINEKTKEIHNDKL